MPVQYGVTAYHQSSMKQIIDAPWLPAAAPFLAYVVLTSIEGYFAKYFVVLYALKLIVTGAVIVCTWKSARRQARFFGEAPKLQDYAIAILMGLALGLTWIKVDEFTPHFAFLGHRTAFNPFAAIGNPVLRALFFALRFSGLVVVVPYVEELFYRSLLLRIVTHPEDWYGSTVGKFNATALAVNIAFFALSHPEWLAAAVFAGAMCLLTRTSKSVITPMVAHAVTNLVLGIVIVNTGNWVYW